KLAELAQKAAEPPKPSPSPTAAPVARAAPRPLLVGVGGDDDPAVAPLRAAITVTAQAWASAHDRTMTATDAVLLAAKTAPHTVASSKAQHAIAFEILDYTASRAEVPLARARVRVRLADSANV